MIAYLQAKPILLDYFSTAIKIAFGHNKARSGRSGYPLVVFQASIEYHKKGGIVKNGFMEPANRKRLGEATK